MSKNNTSTALQLPLNNGVMEAICRLQPVYLGHEKQLSENYISVAADTDQPEEVRLEVMELEKMRLRNSFYIHLAALLLAGCSTYLIYKNAGRI